VEVGGGAGGGSGGDVGEKRMEGVAKDSEGGASRYSRAGGEGVSERGKGVPGKGGKEKHVNERVGKGVKGNPVGAVPGELPAP